MKLLHVISRMLTQSPKTAISSMRLILDDEVDISFEKNEEKTCLNKQHVVLEKGFHCKNNCLEYHLAGNE